ncbi:hypothetical protein LguiA_010189 [Lonicera macranthoides]
MEVNQHSKYFLFVHCPDGMSDFVVCCEEKGCGNLGMLARIWGSLDAGRRAGSRQSPRDNWYQRLVGRSSYEEMSGDMTAPVEREEPDCGELWSFGEGHAL